MNEEVREVPYECLEGLEGKLFFVLGFDLGRVGTGRIETDQGTHSKFKARAGWRNGLKRPRS